ncbi:hypothetical protein EV421DRAFT_2035802 [Armillaria borealis]|uniref:F-box domain-containing protein n=1 Tax=Armillaria borealis TaxID=47425 RepID=A0AA39JHR4_9AGAR|nr:hypothetical protein EV421DRAFT_2035802 [Armillaria borealis]
MNLINRLPPELLAEIFERTIPTGSSNWFMDIWEAPWTIGQVSSSWRRLVLSLPYVWSSISVNTYRKYTVPKLKAALTRSRTAPLTIRLFLSLTSTEQMKEVYQILCNERHRWKSIRITFQRLSLVTAEQFHPLLASGADYPILESFHLVMSVNLPDRFLDRAPMLHEVKMARMVQLQTNALPWSRITKFITTILGIEQLFIILRESPQLHTLEVTDTYREIYSIHPLVHASLTTFGIPVISSFPFLTLPALANLYVRYPLDKNDADIFSAFVSRSNCPLESLRFSFTTFPVSLIDTIASLPTLRELHTAFFDGDVTPLLSALSTPSLILPRLEDLELNQTHKTFGPLRLRTVVDLISYRCEHTPLRCVITESKMILPKRPQAQAPLLAALRELQRRGLVMKILE